MQQFHSLAGLLSTHRLFWAEGMGVGREAEGGEVNAAAVLS